MNYPKLLNIIGQIMMLIGLAMIVVAVFMKVSDAMTGSAEMYALAVIFAAVGGLLLVVGVIIEVFFMVDDY